MMYVSVNVATAVTTIILVIVGVVIGLAWERLSARRASQGTDRRPDSGEPGTNVTRRVILAYSFQSDISFADAARLLGANEEPGRESRSAEFGEWYERDSAWYPKLLSCQWHRGMWLNLYFFDDENILELKFMESDGAQIAAERFALNELLPALGARDVKPTESVN